MKAFMKEFKEFINRGNVMDMAVGIIIGGAFTAIVTSLVEDIIMPIISLISGGIAIDEWGIALAGGGIIGIGISYGLSYVINHYGQQVFGALLNAGSLWGGSTESQISVIPFWLPFLAAGFAMMVGVVSGYYPASRATKISAIEALRNE